MTSYLNDELAIERLVKEYDTHKNLIIGFDFDGTVYDYHKKGLELTPVIDLLQICSALGFTMCLWTVNAEGGMTEYDKVRYCEASDIRVDFVNTSPLFSCSKKAFFSILLDDRAGLSASYNILRTALTRLNLLS